MVHIEQITPQLTWRLRRDELYPAKKVFEMEMDEDQEGIHFGAFKEDKLVAVVSLFNEGTEFQFRKLAVDSSMQKQGVGNKILKYITEYARENGGTKIWCNARVSAIDFYLKADFKLSGKPFSQKWIRL